MSEFSDSVPHTVNGEIIVRQCSLDALSCKAIIDALEYLNARKNELLKLVPIEDNHSKWLSEE